MYKIYKILFFCMIFVEAPAFSQIPSFIQVQVTKTEMSSPVNSGTIITRKIINTLPLPKPGTVPAGYYITQLGFFCKQELKLEKLTKVPFRFRLGSIDDCNRMEGKFKRY